MRKLIIVMVISANAFANVNAYQLTESVTARFSGEQVLSMLKEGRTCIKDGVRVLAKSKDITKRHCQKSKILGLRVIKANQLPVNIYTALTGLK